MGKAFRGYKSINLKSLSLMMSGLRKVHECGIFRADWQRVKERRLTHALITGGAGFVGSHLAERLLKAGQTVTIIDNLTSGQYANIKQLETNPNFHVVIEDI